MLSAETSKIGSWIFRTSSTICAAWAALLIRQGLARSLHLDPPPFMTFYPMVMVVALCGGFWLGCFATALAAALIEFFIFAHVHQVAVANLSDTASLLLFVGICILISGVAERYRRAQRRVIVLEKQQALREADRKIEKLTSEQQKLLATLTAALESMTDGVLITDAEGNFIQINEAFASIYRFKNKEECSKSFAEIVKLLDVFTLTGESLPPELWTTQRALRGERATHFEYRVRRKDRSEEWIGSMSFGPIRGANGKILGAVITARDVTERKRAEERLRLTNDRFELALRNSPVVVFTQDRNLVYTWIHNPALGFEEDHVIGKRDLELFERQEDALVTEELKREVIETGVSQRKEVTIREKSLDRCYDLQVDPLRDTAGAIVGVACAAIDRTERKQAELAQQENAQLLSLALEASQSGFFNWDILANTVDWSVELEHLYGIDPGCFSGSLARWKESVFPEDLACVETLAAEALRTGVLRGKWRIIRQNDGEVRWLSGSGKVIYDTRGQPLRLVGINVDITEIERAHEALLRSEKLASLGRMSAAIAHEINNPLGAITNLLFLARHTPELPAPAQQFIDDADDELKRIAHVTRQSLGFYRENSAPELISLTGVLDSTVNLLKTRIIAKNARVIKRWNTEFKLMAVGGELRQVFSNLLVNSLDAISEFGVIEIRVLTFRDVRDGRSFVRVTVADNGKGISARSRDQLFEPFFTTKGNIGTGLGLWVSRQIVDKHKGRIRVRSSEGGRLRGTVFAISFPLGSGVEGVEESEGAWVGRVRA